MNRDTDAQAREDAAYKAIQATYENDEKFRKLVDEKITATEDYKECAKYNETGKTPQVLFEMLLMWDWSLTVKDPLGAVELFAGEAQEDDPSPSGQLWEPCPRCGNEPVYMSLGDLCEDCGVGMHRQKQKDKR